jgi:hypothetical protein
MTKETKEPAKLKSPKMTEEAAGSESQQKNEDAAQLESLKMTKDWSVWLILLQSSICTFLWDVLKGQLEVLHKVVHSPPPLPVELQNISVTTLKWQIFVMHLSWLSFAASVVTAIILVSRLPSLIKQIPLKNAHNQESSPKTLMTMEFGFFLFGVLLIVVFIIWRFVGAIFF